MITDKKVTDNELIAIIKNTPLFQHLTLDEVKEISPLFQYVSYKPNNIIVFQGDLSDKLYIIKKGIVVVKTIKHGLEKEIIHAYLLPGDTFGEVGVLENSPRSATIISVNDIEAIYIERNEFFKILNRFSSVAIELARELSRYLINMTNRMGYQEDHLKLILTIPVNPEKFKPNFPQFLISHLSSMNSNNSVMLSYPIRNPGNALENVSPHPNNFNILSRKTEEEKLTELAVVLDKLTKSYYNILVNIEQMDNGVPLLLEKAMQVIILTDSDQTTSEIEKIKKYVSRYINQGKCSVYTLEFHESNPSNLSETNYTFPLPSIQELYQEDYCKNKFTIPEIYTEVVQILIERLEKNRQLSIYIPTTLNIDQPIDTTKYVKESLELFGNLFGGATKKTAEGVWKSAELGLVNEEVYIVTTYSNSEKINLYMDEIINYAREMKIQLQQEAIAIELDEKLFLV